MAIDPQSFKDQKMVDYVERSIEAMKDSLEDKDWGIVGGIRTMAEYCDSTKLTVEALDLDGNAEPKDRIRAMELHNKAVYTIPQIISGLEKLGGSIAARKALDIKPEKPKSGLAAVRELRTGTEPAAGAPSARKTPSRARKKP